MRKKIGLIIVLFAIVIIAGLALKHVLSSQNKPEVKKEAIHYHAGFQVYKDGELVDFSDLKFMHDEPCTLDGKPAEDDHEDEQIEKAHLHDLVGDVVHVHRKNVVWGDLFKNLEYTFPSGTEFYLNEEKIETGFTTPIKAYDSLTIFVGEDPLKEENLLMRVTKEHIQEVEKRSETCGSGS